MDYQREYLQVMFNSLERHLHLLPSIVQRDVKLARSVVETHGSATPDEMRKQLGDNWVLAKRTKNIVARYGPDVKCYSHARYHAAERTAIEARFPALK
jgi:hypothetical protein